MFDVEVDFVGYLRSLYGFYVLGTEESDDRQQNENSRDSAKHDGRSKQFDGRGEIDLRAS
jgi:hypothetical protein